MIAFTIKKDEYFIDDDFNVVIGKYKKEIQKDIELFFMDFPASGGDEVLVYKERLEKFFNAKIEDYKSIKRPFGTVDCSEYDEYGNTKEIVGDEDELVEKETEKNNVVKDSNFFNKVLYFFKRGNKSIPVKEKDTGTIIENRKNFAMSYGINEENATKVAKMGILDENGMPLICYRGHNGEDNGGDWLLGNIFSLSNRYDIASRYGDVKKYFVVPEKPHILKSVKKSIELLENGESDCCIVKNDKSGETEIAVKNKSSLIEIK